MPNEPHWSSLRRKGALTDQSPPFVRSRNGSRARHEFDRRLTLGSMGKWVVERQKPTQGVILGDVGNWFKSKLPSHRPERGGTLRSHQHWDRRETSRNQSPQLPRLDVDDPSSGTGGSDLLLDWNTPKNLSEALPNRGLQKTTSHRRWNNFNYLRLRNKLDQKTLSDGIESKKDKQGQAKGNAHERQSFNPAMQMMSGILEILEATKKARKTARDNRESLIESGDYLGTQGINPQTGVLDLTSESDGSALSVRTEQKLAKLETQVKNAASAVERKEAETEIIKIHLDNDIAKMRRREKAEKQLAKWRKSTHQWLSVQEPDLSPIAQSHMSISALSRRESHRDHGIVNHESLTDISLPEDQAAHEQSHGITISTSLRSRESAHSSDTVVKTPHRHSIAPPSSAALDLIRNGISFHSTDKLGLDRDLFAEHDTGPSTIHAQTASDLLPEMSDAQKVTEAHTGANRTRRNRNTVDINQLSSITRSLDDKSFSDRPQHQLNIGEERMQDAKLPGGQSAKRLHARFDDNPREIHYPPDSFETNRVRIHRKPVPTGSGPGRPSPNSDRTRVELASDGIPRSKIELGATEDGQFRAVANSPASAETSSVKSWDKARPTTPERGRAVSDSRSSHRSTISNESDSVARAAKSTQDKERNRSQQRHNKKEPYPAQYAVPNNTRDQRSRHSSGLRTRLESEHHKYVRGQGGVCIHEHHHHYWVHPDSINIPPEKGTAGPRESVPQAQTQPDGPQPATLRDDAKQFRYLPDESWAENVEMEKTGRVTLQEDNAPLENGCPLSRTDPRRLDEQAMELGAQMSGGLRGHQDAEEDIADLSSNRLCQSEKGGLWEAIKEFLCTISEYSMWLMRWYFGTVRPVFDLRSPYWRCTDQGDRSWMNLVSLCLALPLIFGLSMVLVWGMELTVIAMRCMDEDQDCMADEALAMFRRSLTGVYPYE
ncbi:hypothetical protein FLONG3_9348 [Fusarium longipes]|uniref:Uncharacterized protein n=1 Tax=Fusarium longipes TaxID=694270 RepID=A0A395RXX3_9HYPO|nr:hypothetical protein FLONG3_9348 [Fusarium longipes]